MFAVTVIMAAAVATTVSAHVRAHDSSGRKSVEISVERAGEGTQVVVIQDSKSAVVLSSAAISVPVGRATIFATFSGPRNELDQLAITTGDRDQIDISSRSTAASLVALSPGVLAIDDSWLGVTGHAIADESFEALVEAVETAPSLSAGPVQEALAATVQTLPISADAGCERACGEWLAATPSLLVDNNALSRAVIAPSEGRSPALCGTAPPATMKPEDAALISGLSLVGGIESDADVDSQPAVVPTLSRLNDMDDCGEDLSVVTGHDGDERQRTAMWVTLLADYAVPLVDVVGGRTMSPNLAELERMAVRAATSPTVPTVSEALTLVLARANDLSETQRETVLAIGRVIGTGLFDDALFEGSRQPVADATAPPRMAPPTTAAPTTAPPVTDPAPTPAPAPAPVPQPVTGGEISVRYPTGQDLSRFQVSVVATNTGETTINMGSTGWRLLNRSTGASVTPTEAAGPLRSGRLSPGASAQGTLRFSVSGSPSTHRLIWTVSPDLHVAADL